jgi:broad specificity phosphatase PhoE
MNLVWIRIKIQDGCELAPTEYVEAWFGMPLLPSKRNNDALSMVSLMTLKLFVVRHSETFDNARGIFSGWRDSELTLKGFVQAQGIAEQLKRYQLDYAFTSHLRRARKTLEIILRYHQHIPVFIDDRLIERCYGLLQGKYKRKVAYENPDWYSQIHRGYVGVPPEGESMSMVENRVFSFLVQLKQWLGRTPGNVVISCHGNSMRAIKRVLENLSIDQMLQFDASQDTAAVYELNWCNSSIERPKEHTINPYWKGVVISRKVKLATDPLNLLEKYYC